MLQSIALHSSAGDKTSNAGALEDEHEVEGSNNESRPAWTK